MEQSRAGRRNTAELPDRSASSVRIASMRLAYSASTEDLITAALMGKAPMTMTLNRFVPAGASRRFCTQVRLAAGAGVTRREVLTPLIRRYRSSATSLMISGITIVDASTGAKLKAKNWERAWMM